MTEKRPDKKADLVSLIHQYVESGSFVETVHARQRHNEREIILPDVLYDYQGAVFCCFREGLGYKGDNGSIRILECNQKGEWKSAAFLKKSGTDLRAPHFSIVLETAVRTHHLSIFLAGVITATRDLSIRKVFSM